MDASEQNRLFEDWAMTYQGMVRSVARAFATGGERDELAREILAALMVLVYVPLLPWAVAGLVVSGKMDAHSALGFGVLTAAQVLFFGAFCIVSFVSSIGPRTRRLRALGADLGLKDLENT